MEREMNIFSKNSCNLTKTLSRRLWAFVCLFNINVCINYTYADNTNQIGLRWDKSAENNVNYRAYRSLKQGAITNFVERVESGTNMTCRIGTADPGLPAFYVVTAYDNQGNESLPSNEIIWITPWVTQTKTPNGLLVRFLRVPANGNLEYFLESSDDLTHWVDGTQLITHLEHMEDGTEMVEALVSYSKPKEFYRVKVTIK